MSTANENTVAVEFDPTATNKQADVIPGATPTKAGVMTAAQAAQLAGLSKGSFAYIVTQPGDGSDFIVPIPAALQLGTTNYRVGWTISTANVFTGVAISFADNALTQFRVTTDGDLPNGTILIFSLEKIA